MIKNLRVRLIVCAFATTAAFGVAAIAAAQSEAPHKPGAPGMRAAWAKAWAA